MLFSSVRIPLKYKFLGVTLFIMLTALSVFFYFANRIFSEDKKLFVLDLNLTVLRAATSEINFELKSRLDQLEILIPRVYRFNAQTTPADPFVGLPPNLQEEVLSVTFYRQDDPKKDFETVSQYQNSWLFGKRKLPPDTTSVINEAHPLPLKSMLGKTDLTILNRSTHITLRSINSELAILTFVIPGSLIDADSKGVVIAIDIFQDFLRKKLQQSELAELFLITREGYILSNSSMSQTIDYASTPYPHPIVPHLQAKHFPRESFELQVKGDPYLCNVSDTGFPGIYAVSQIKKSEAFKALTILLQKSALLAALIFCTAIIVSLLFAGHLTSNIEKLRQAAQRIGNGELDVKLKITSNDEIQSVSESFQWMANRLRELISEHVQKARMERELETARLVQSTILTNTKVVHSGMELTAHYEPASECGGDFWDANLVDNKLTVFIGDATGHGAPAAIVTAVAKSCFSTLNAIYADSPLSPEQFLAILNQIIHEACKGKLLMTMCVMQLDLSTGELVVSNAGHESPLCLKGNSISSRPGNSDKKRKNSAEVLFTRGERLGFSLDAVYESSKFNLSAGDTVLLYTDGISEAQNLEGKEWGERALKNAFTRTGPKPLSTIKEQLIKGVNEHTAGAPQGDDITFVLLSWKGTNQAQPAKPSEEAAA